MATLTMRGLQEQINDLKAEAIETIAEIIKEALRREDK